MRDLIDKLARAATDEICGTIEYGGTGAFAGKGGDPQAEPERQEISASGECPDQLQQPARYRQPRLSGKTHHRRHERRTPRGRRPQICQIAHAVVPLRRPWEDPGGGGRGRSGGRCL